MKELLSATSLEEAEKEERETQTDDSDVEDEIRQVLLSRGRQTNLSFFGFTATPKPKTLEVFGEKGIDGKPRPFHLYSMRQAIEEGFILDVLEHYTTYKTYFKLSKAIEEDPELNRKKASTAIARFVSLHPTNLAQKTEVIVEHFRSVSAKKIGGKAKAMVVTSSRLHALKYYQEFKTYIQQKGYGDIKGCHPECCVRPTASKQAEPFCRTRWLCDERNLANTPCLREKGPRSEAKAPQDASARTPPPEPASLRW